MTHVEPALIADRRARVLSALAASALDHALLSGADNIRYATNFRSLIVHETADHMMCLLGSDGHASVFGPHVRETVDTSNTVDDAVHTVHPLVGWVPMECDIAAVVRTLADALTAAGARRVGYDVMHPLVLDGLRHALPHLEFVYAGATLFEVRREKLAAELGLLQAAAEDNLAALDAAFATARAGMSDRDVLAVAVGHQQRANAELITHFSCNINAGAGWFPSGRVLHEGDSLFVDQVYYGPGGYASDVTRTAFLGEPPAEVARGYRRLVEIAQHIHAACRTGVNVATLDDFMNELLRKNGFPHSPYGLGHGVGLRVMEPPSIIGAGIGSGGHILRRGETVALEPETWIEYRGTRVPLKVEDCFVVEDDGARVIGRPAPPDPQILAV